MADRIGGVTSSMDAAAANFKAKAEEFLTSLQQVTSAAENLRADWWGQGNVSFEAVMTKWNTDAKNIVQDLEMISQNVKGSSQSFQQLDADLSKAWSGFGG